MDVLYFDFYSTGTSSSATHRTSVGNAIYSLPPSSVSAELSSIVINPESATNVTLTVHYVDSSGWSNPCRYYDSVDILEFGMDGVPKRLAR